MSWETKLTEMKGKVFNYHGQPCHLLNYERAGDNITILTDLDDYEMPASEVAAFLEDFQLPTAVVPRPANRLRQADTGLLVLAGTPALQKMQQALMAALDKVQNQPAYVQQAQEVSRLVQTGINLAKVELTAYQLTNQPR